jgi:outer membrane protein TolC
MKKIVSRMLFCANLLGAGSAAAQSPDSLNALLAPATPGGLTSDAAATRARETSFDAAGKADALKSASAKLQQALVAYAPKLTLTARYTRLSPLPPITFSQPTTPTTPPMTGMGTMMGNPSTLAIPIPVNSTLFQASLDIPLSDYALRLSQSYASASRNKRAATLDEQASRLKAALDGRQYYYAWLRGKAQVVVEERALDQARGHLEDARHSFEVGTASKADVLTVESQLATQELTLERAQNVARLAEDQLRIAMHDSSGQPFAVGEDLNADLAPLPGLHNLDALRAEALDRRLEIRALDETMWSLREQAKATRAGYLPRIDAIGNLIMANPNPRVFTGLQVFTGTWDVGVQLIWTPNDTFNTVGASADAEARASQTEMQKAALRDTVKIEVLQAYQSLRESEDAVQTTKRALDAAEEGYRVRRELFRNGRATSVELTDSEVQLSRAGNDAVDARANLRFARASLLHAIGRDVPPALLADSR